MDDGILPVRADGMAQDLARAVLVVEPDVEQRPTVRRPFEVSVIVGDVGIDDGAGRGLDDVNGAEFRALCIDGISDEPVVGAVRDIGNAEIGMVLGECVAVDQNLLIAAVAREPAEQGMLTARHEARVVGERAVRRRHRGIVFLDTFLHLGEELLLQLFGVGHEA